MQENEGEIDNTKTRGPRELERSTLANRLSDRLRFASSITAEGKLMKTRKWEAMAAAMIAYALLILPLTRVRAQGRPVAPRAPRTIPALPVAPEIPAVPATLALSGLSGLPALPEMPAMPALPELPALPALASVPAMPVVPEVPAAPDWGSEPTTYMKSGHWDREPASDCSDLHIRLEDEKPTIQSEEHTLTKAEAPLLRIREIQNGGVQLQGWDKETYSVTACKAAIGNDAQQLLSQIHLSVQGGEVSVSGPGHHNEWTVYLLIRTPRGASVDVAAHNGPVSFYSVDGKITTRATNGPVSLKDCSGEADISADNGPISFSGSSGKLRLHTQNGPITVALASGWNGSELVADAVNGPLTLRVPSDFRSSFLVESNGHSPMSCHASICSDARKTWDDEHRRIEYGSGSPGVWPSYGEWPTFVAG